MVQEASGKSPNMERIAFKQELFLWSNVEVSTIVTDAHPQISTMLRKTDKYAGICHQYDIWHGSKNLSKKLSKAAQQREYSELMPWIPRITNHFWHSAMTCEGDLAKLMGSLPGMLHHVVNEHEWHFTVDGRAGECKHGPLEEEHEVAWRQRGSSAHQKLHDILHDKRFMKSIDNYTKFVHTGYRESFHSTLLMYASKRSFFTFLGYSIRVQLAVMDTNFHTDRPQAKTKDGKSRWVKKWKKRTKRYTLVPILEPQSYACIPDLHVSVFMKRATTPGQDFWCSICPWLRMTHDVCTQLFTCD